MAEFPCLPLWTDAYLADTSHLTTEEHGAYLLLLIQAWRTPGCSLPDDDTLLARHAGLSPAKWKTAKPIIMAFWKHDKRKNQWRQKRLKKEREKAAEKRQKAKDSATSRWKGSNSGDANAMPTQCSPEPTPTYEKTSVFSKRASAKKNTGWVEPLKVTDAARNLIQEIRENDSRRLGASDEVAGAPVLQLPSVRTG